jgi:hypothetical protein
LGGSEELPAVVFGPDNSREHHWREGLVTRMTMQGKESGVCPPHWLCSRTAAHPGAPRSLKSTEAPKSPMCTWMDEKMNKTWSIQTVEEYSALEKKEILTHATTWMNLEGIICSVISQPQRTNNA